MKTLALVISFFVATLQSQGQVAPTNASELSSRPPEYSLISRSAHEQVWERTTSESLPRGKAVLVKHRITELQSGLNYWDGSQWQASREEIEILPNGGATASQGQHTVRFPSDIYGGVVSMTTPDGTVLNSQVVGLSYSDGTNSILIATVTNSIGQVLPSGNQLIYTNAFVGGGINASVRYT